MLFWIPGYSSRETDPLLYILWIQGLRHKVHCFHINQTLNSINCWSMIISILHNNTSPSPLVAEGACGCDSWQFVALCDWRRRSILDATMVSLIMIVVSSPLQLRSPNHSSMQGPATPIWKPKIWNVSSISMRLSVRKRGGESTEFRTIFVGHAAHD